MLEVCRNRRRMKQRADLGAAKFFWPKIAEMIEWKLNWHTVVLARSVGWIERSALDVSYAAKPLLFSIARGVVNQPASEER